MSYALILKESGEGCDYTFGCGWKPVVFNHYPTDEEIAPVVEDHGLDRFESITVVKIEKIIGRAALEDLVAGDDDDEPEEDVEKETRRLEYERLRVEFGG